MAYTTRNLSAEDINQALLVEQESLHTLPNLQATREQIQRRIEFFPVGQFGWFEDGTLVGATYSQIISHDGNDPIAYNTAVGSEGILHNPDGNSLYLISAVILPTHRGTVDARDFMLEPRIALARELSLEMMLSTTRIPGYAQYVRENGEILIRDYVRLKKDGWLNWLRRQGFEFDESDVLENSRPEDTASGGHGIFIRYRINHSPAS